jgi:hypothetical protein
MLSYRVSMCSLLLASISFLALPTVASAHPPHDIQAYILRHSQDGVFSIYDARMDKPLALKVGEIHQRGSKAESGEVYHCVDFTNGEGKDYDLDFYLASVQGVNMVVEIVIHKADGNDRIRPAEDASPVDDSAAASIREAIGGHWKNPIAIQDSRNRRGLDLTLDNLHEGVKALKDGSFYACVDARSSDGTLYDLDTYVRPSGDGYDVVETLIHKRDGKERLR